MREGDKLQTWPQYQRGVDEARDGLLRSVAKALAVVMDDLHGRHGHNRAGELRGELEGNLEVFDLARASPFDTTTQP